jgi:hypothetical protein
LKDSLQTQKSFLDSVGQKIGVRGNDLSPWYDRSQKFLIKLGCSRVLNIYNGSMYGMLKTVYPEHKWVAWRFKKIPQLFTVDPNVMQEILSFAESQLGIAKPEDWYNVLKTHLKVIGVYPFITEAGGLYSVLKRHRPNIKWEIDKFAGIWISGKLALREYLRNLLPNHEILDGYTLSPGAVITYLLPSLKVGFVYQSVPDYGLGNLSGSVPVWHFEDEKIVLEAKSQGLSVLFVPFWWDRSQSSLLASILEKFPQLGEFIKIAVSAKTKPIPQETTVTLSKWRDSRSEEYWVKRK